MVEMDVLLIPPPGVVGSERDTRPGPTGGAIGIIQEVQSHAMLLIMLPAVVGSERNTRQGPSY